MQGTNAAGGPTASIADWGLRLDKFCAVTGALVPVGLAIGNVGFEGAIAVVGLGWIVRCFVARENPMPRLWRHPLAIPWTAWFASIVVSLVVNGPGSKGWAHDVVFIRYVIYSLALLDISQRLPVAKYLLYGLAAGVLWSALNTLSAYLLCVDFVGHPLIRYTGKLKEASRISGLCAYAVPFFVSWAIAGNRLSRRHRRILLLIGCVAFAQALQTRIRTAILSGAAGISFALLVMAKKKRWPLAAIAVLAVLAFGAVFYLGSRIDLRSLYDRIYIWKVAWRMWLEHPIFGVGVSAFSDVYKATAAGGAITDLIAPSGTVYSPGEATHAHNLFLMIGASTGLVGLAAFTWLFVAAVRLIFKKPQGVRAGLVSWPAVLFSIGLTGYNIYDSWYLALVTFFLALIGVSGSGGAERPAEG